MTLEVDSLLFGNFVGSWLKVGCKLVVEGGWFKTSEDRKDDRPQVGKLFKCAREETSHSVSKVEVGLFNKELVEGMEVLNFVWVEQTSGMFFRWPELDIVGDCIFFEAIDESMVPEEIFGFFNILVDELSEASKAG